MPNAIDQRLASLLHQRRIRALTRIDRLTNHVGRIYQQMGRDLLRLAAVPEANVAEGIDATIGVNYAQAHSTIAAGFRAEIRGSHHATADAMLRAVPWRWFRKVHPMVMEAEEPVFDDLSKADKAEFILGHVFPPPDAQAVEEMLDYAGPGGMAWDERLDHWEAGTRERIRTGLIGAISDPEGVGVPSIRKILEPLVGDIRYKAQRIARTEGRRVAELAQQHAYQQVAELLDGMQVIASLDQHTRAHHAARHGKKYDQQANGEYIAADGEGLPVLPDEPNCVLPGQTVSGIFEAGLRAEYSGQVFQFRTAADNVLRVTRNHPVLTTDGWMPAHRLREGVNVVRYVGDIKRPIEVADHEQHEPTMIEQVFGAFVNAGASTKSPSASFNLHGDEVRCKGYIDVVATHGELLFDAIASRNQLGSNKRFVGGDMQAFSVPGGRPGSFDFDRIVASSPGFPGFGDLTAHSGGVGLQTLPLQSLSIGPAANLHARLAEQLREGLPVDATVTRDLLQGFPGEVSLDQIAEVRQYHWSGHVYDLQTAIGWYWCNGIIIHNCRCYASPLLAVPAEVENDPIVRAQFENVHKDVIPDPGSYNQWWAFASDAEKRRSVGGRRYSIVAKRLASQGRVPEWEDFLDPTGKLMPVQKLKRQTWKAWQNRRGKVAEMVAERERVMRQVAATGFDLGSLKPGKALANTNGG